MLLKVGSVGSKLFLITYHKGYKTSRVYIYCELGAVAVAGCIYSELGAVEQEKHEA